MEKNRIQELLRDPTFESPSRDYFEVRMPWLSVAVSRETAERILEALFGLHRTEGVQGQTVEGSVVHIRVRDVVFVREWTATQRETGRKFWKAIDEEYEEKEEPPTAPEGGEEEPESTGDANEPGIRVVLIAGTVLLLVLNLLKAVLL